MKHIALIIAILSTIAISSCKGTDDNFIEPKAISSNAISRIEISPNSMVLNANGKSELNFLVRCYYKVDSQEVQMLADRVPVEQIKIACSTGKIFTPNSPFTTKNTNDSISFTATFNNIKSNTVKVALRKLNNLQLKPLRIPIVFVALYTDKQAQSIQNINKKLLQKIIQHANDAFMGAKANTPNGSDAKMQFYLKEYKTQIISNEDDQDINQYIKKNQLSDVQNAVYVWLVNSVPWRMNESKIAPKYILDNAEDLPGIKWTKLKQKKEFDNLLKKQQVDPTNVGIVMTFNDVYQQQTGYASREFNRLLGRFYGLLPTSVNPNNYDNQKDIDYCDDTFSYIEYKGTVEKQTIPYTAKKVNYFYYSYNIMDNYSTSVSLSVDQVKRIRQVIKHCLCRQQADKN